MILALVAGATLGLGAVWLLLETILRYLVRHDVRIINWVGKWPSSDAEQHTVNRRLDDLEARELTWFRRARPVPIAFLVLGVILIVVALA